MPAEAIARVWNDLVEGRVHYKTPDEPAMWAEWADQVTKDAVRDHGPLVDVTSVYRQIAREDVMLSFYDKVCAPPWESAVLCYENRHGNVHVMALVAYDQEDHSTFLGRPSAWEPAETVEWERVRWRINVWVYSGGMGGGKPQTTFGPNVLLQFAVYPDGVLADLHWQLCGADDDDRNWMLPAAVICDSLNFLNCRNVELVEARHDRPTRRRLERLNAPTLHTINVFPMGRSVRRDRSGTALGGVPVHTVRGHFAEYGPQYGKGLLFNKYEGRFFRPMHVRGDPREGESEGEYKLRADG